jgi:pimeloyl-ACP methyl ester carboxylesterase
VSKQIYKTGFEKNMLILNQQFRLPDGRQLGYDEYGVPDGRPLFYFHGAPSARVEFSLFGSDALLQSLNTRLIAVDRPGMGLSDFQPDRQPLDFPNDLLALADALDIKRFAILAYSLGGPPALASAFAIPGRLSKVGIVSGAALFNRPELMQNINEGTRRYLNLPRENPFAARMFLGMMSLTARFLPSVMISNAASLLPEPDRAFIKDSAIQKGFIQLVREAFRQGTRGAFHESLMTVSDWGYRLEEIQTPLRLWHGELDQNIPVGMARYLETIVPKCEAEFYPGEGHLSLFGKRAAEIIQALTF